MRLPGFLFAMIFIIGNLIPVCTYGQGAGDQHPAEQPLEPYRKHHDTHNGHDHLYPDRGAIVRDVPREATMVNYAGLTYRFHDGIWFEPRGPAFMVVAPPIGLVVPALPQFVTVLARHGQTYLYCNDVYYQPRPDLGGYEVVNDPAEAPSQPGATAAVAVPVVGTPAPATQAVAVPLENASVKASPPAQMPGVAVPTATATMSTPAAEPTIPTPPATAPVSAATAAVARVPVPAGSPPDSSSGQQKGTRVFLYPKNGQSADQQARDRYDCYRFAVAQSGFDPMRSTAGAPNSELQADYDRAQGACFEARGYAVR